MTAHAAPTATSSTAEVLARRIAFLGPAKDPEHVALHDDLRAALRRIRGLREAYLANVRYARNAAPVLALCVTVSPSMQGRILPMISRACEMSEARFEQLDIVVMTGKQAMRLERTGRPFFVFHPGYLRV